MSDENNKEEKLKNLVKNALEGSANKQPENESKNASISIAGNNNMVAGGNIININSTPKIITKIKKVPQAADAITPSQQSELHVKIKEWIDAHNKVKNKELTYAAAWSSFNKSQRVARYSDIQQKDFPKAKKWLSDKIGQILSMKSSLKKDSEFRTKAYRAIHARSAQLGDKLLYKPYIIKQFNCTSLTELTDKELQQTRQWILRKK